MKATSFKETNHVLGAGNNPNTDQLPVAISLDPQCVGPCFMVSKWKMTDEEREHFMKTGEVWLSVMADPTKPTQAPVMLTPYNPFEYFQFESLDLTE